MPDTDKTYKSINVIHLEADTTYPHHETTPEVAHMTDPALDVMTNFDKVPPTTIRPDETIDFALMEMRVSGEHVLLVVDRDDNVVGLISSGDIQGAKPVKVIQEKRIKRNEIKVEMVMTPQNKIPTLDMEDLRHAKVGNVVQTLKELKQHYAVVVAIDEENKKQTVHGLFSLSRIGKQLNIDVTSLLPEAHSLAELQHLHS